MSFTGLVLISILPALVITAALKDLTSMTIPNWISGLLVLGFVPAAWAAGLGVGEMGLHLAVGVGGLLIGMGLFAARVIGGGDAKLMAAAALWLGLKSAGLFLLWTGVAGGLFCLALIMARRSLQPYAAGTGGWMGQLLEPKGDIPYGVAICAGVLMAFPDSPLAIGLSAFG
jgi:prepilin peptidase CpaA